MRQSYGCVKCQSRHYTGNPLFKDHIMFQSKHGLRDESEPEPKPEAGHTPLNWRLETHAGHCDHPVEIKDQGGNLIALVCGKPNSERNNRGAFIVRACNSHDALLAACKDAAELLRTAKRYFPKSIRNQDTFHLLNVEANSIIPAIAKAEGRAQ